MALMGIKMSESGRNTSSEWNLRNELEFASYGVASSNSSKWSNLKRNDKLKPIMGFSLEEPVSGRKGSNKDDIANTNYGVLDATNAQDTDGSYNMEMSPGLEDYKNKCNQSLKDGCSRLVRSRSRSPPRSFRWDSGRVGGLTQPYCRDFIAGKCRRGNRCRFLHHNQNYGDSWENRHRYSAPNENNSYSRTIGRSYNRTCFHYAQGRCKMGASCNYGHDDNFDRRRTESSLQQGVQYGTNQNRLHGESPFSSDIKKSNWDAKNDSANVHTSQTVGVDIWLDNEKMSPPNWIHDVRSSTHINQEQQGQSKQQVAPGQVVHQNVSKTFIKPEPVVRFPKQRDPRCNSREQKNVNATGGVSLAYFPNRQLVKNEHPVQLKGIHTFKFSLVELVKELLKPTWKDGKITKEDYKAIVKKVTDKVIDTVQRAHIPQTQEKIDCYLSSSKSKLNKLVQAYVEKFQKA